MRRRYSLELCEFTNNFRGHALSDDAMSICRRGLRRHFNIPSKVTKINVVFSRRPGKDRVGLRLHDTYPEVIEIDGRRARTLVTKMFERQLARHGARYRVVYISVEYTEPAR